MSEDKIPKLLEGGVISKEEAERIKREILYRCLSSKVKDLKDKSVKINPQFSKRVSE